MYTEIQLEVYLFCNNILKGFVVLILNTEILIDVTYIYKSTLGSSITF